MKYFNKLECHKIMVPSDVGVMRSMISNHVQKELCVTGPIKGELLSLIEENIKKPDVTSLYVKVYLSCLLPEKQVASELSETSLQSLQSYLEKIDRE